jgi:hypothetical protein
MRHPKNHSIRTRIAAATALLLAASALTLAVGAEAAVAAPSSVNDTSPAITYSAGWIYTTTATGYVSGDAHYASTTGASASYLFTGKSVILIGGKNTDHGRADVKVCDASGVVCGPTTIIDTYSTVWIPQQALYSADGLGAGQHRLVITVRSDSTSTGQIQVPAQSARERVDVTVGLPLGRVAVQLGGPDRPHTRRAAQRAAAGRERVQQQVETAWGVQLPAVGTDLPMHRLAAVGLTTAPFRQVDGHRLVLDGAVLRWSVP